MLGIADILHLVALLIGMPMRQKKHFLIEIIANKNHNENCRKKYSWDSDCDTASVNM